jgi:hypothetical protein
MDQELKAYLDTKFDEVRTYTDTRFDEMRTYTGAKFDEMRSYTDTKFDRTVQAFAGEIGSLHTQIQQTEARVVARIDSLDSRLQLHAGLLQSGARALARFSEYAENSEQRWVALVSRVEALEKKLEGR